MIFNAQQYAFGNGPGGGSQYTNPLVLTHTPSVSGGGGSATYGGTGTPFNINLTQADYVLIAASIIVVILVIAMRG